MKWSMDTHKYMSEVTRKALQVLAELNINAESEPEEIEAAERKLAEVGVYKGFEGAKGRIRRALFTYFKAYDCMNANCFLTEVGEAFVENKLSIQEISFYYVVNYLYENNDIKYYPLQFILKCLSELYKNDPQNAYLTAYDFSLIVECDGIDQINDTFINNISQSHVGDAPVVNERAIGFDVWAKMLTQAGIVDFIEHKLYLLNIELAEWILESYKKDIKRIRGSLTSGVLKHIPKIATMKGKGDPSAFEKEGQALQACLFDGVPEKTINKYIVIDPQCTIEKMRETLGLTKEQAGYYSAFSGLERLVGRSLYQTGTGLQKAIGEILLNIEVTEKEECEEMVENDKSKLLPNLPPRTRKRYPLNNILYGAPGTGKTYSTAQYALAIAEDKEFEQIASEARSEVMDRYNILVSAGRIVFTTFHQNYGYEDFIQGIRPDTSSSNMAFKTVDGVFKVIAEKAMENPQLDYVIIIDEINRANISKVFGELITLIEDDKRWGEVNAIDVTLPSGEIFAVPNNLYIIGTMNSADKSISLIDTALRRRFDFVEYEPKSELVNDPDLKKILERLNSGISSELGSTDLLIGHSYFMNKTLDDLTEIMNRNIIPLLYEYFFDNQKKVEAQVKAATEGYPVEVKAGTVGRIKLIKKGV